jgi:organic radical activating enzyme
MTYRINRLDFNIAYACNLSCKGCISLSDFPRKGVESFESLKLQCETWCNIVTPKIISIFGGEPLMHPRLIDVLLLIRKHWPDAIIRLITNGYLLKKYDPADWFKFGPFEMQISVHRKDHEPFLNKEIKKILQCKSKWKPFRGTDKEHRNIGFVHDYVTIYKSRFKDFIMPYNLKDNKIMPFTSDPKKAHAICGSPDTPILYKNKLFKCAPIANILDLDDNNFYNYKGLRSNENIHELINNINKPESICSMCPENKEHSIDHFNKENVHVKNFN